MATTDVRCASTKNSLLRSHSGRARRRPRAGHVLRPQISRSRASSARTPLATAAAARGGPSAPPRADSSASWRPWRLVVASRADVRVQTRAQSFGELVRLWPVPTAPGTVGSFGALPPHVVLRAGPCPVLDGSCRCRISASGLRARPPESGEGPAVGRDRRGRRHPDRDGSGEPPLLAVRPAALLALRVLDMTNLGHRHRVST